MYPVICKFGSLTVYTYGVMVALAFLTATYLMQKNAGRFGVDKSRIIDLMIVILISGLIGARLLHVAVNWDIYAGDPLSILMITRGGLAIYGGMISGSIAGLVYLKKNNINIWSAGDLLAPYLFLGQAMGRIGCFFNGCCYGKQMTPDHRFPVQLVSALALVAFYALLRYFHEKKIFYGSLFFIYLILYSAQRFFLEYFRGDVPVYWHGWTVSQFISVAVFILGLTLLIWRQRTWNNLK